MFDYDDDLDNYDNRDNYYDQSSSYDYRDELFQTSSWNPRDAVLAWQTTPYDTRRYPDQRPGLVPSRCFFRRWIFRCIGRIAI